jgi:hypothetical protein
MVDWVTAALAAHGGGGGLPASIGIGNAYAERSANGDQALSVAA